MGDRQFVGSRGIDKTFYKGVYWVSFQSRHAPVTESLGYVAGMLKAAAASSSDLLSTTARGVEGKLRACKALPRRNCRCSLHNSVLMTLNDFDVITVIEEGCTATLDIRTESMVVAVEGSTKSCNSAAHGHCPRFYLFD